MMNHIQFRVVDSRNQYIEHFFKALDNFELVCKEYKNTPLCRRTRRNINQVTTKH